MLQRIRLLALLLVAMFGGGANAAPVADLYTATAPVIDLGEGERRRGFREGLSEVIVRLTGDASLQNSRRIEPLLDIAEKFVARHAYNARAVELPGNSGQPHTLTVEFDKQKLNPALEAFGLNLWGDDRPLTAVFLGVKDGRGSYVLGADGEKGSGQREILTSAAARRGAPIVLPGGAPLAGVSYDTIAAGDVDALIPAAKTLGAESVLFGALQFDGDAYWTVQWSLIWFGHDIKTWEKGGVTFDIALREAIEAAAKLYSGLATR